MIDAELTLEDKINILIELDNLHIEKQALEESYPVLPDPNADNYKKLRDEALEKHLAVQKQINNKRNRIIKLENTIQADKGDEDERCSLSRDLYFESTQESGDVRIPNPTWLTLYNEAVDNDDQPRILKLLECISEPKPIENTKEIFVRLEILKSKNPYLMSLMAKTGEPFTILMQHAYNKQNHSWQHLLTQFVDVINGCPFNGLHWAIYLRNPRAIEWIFQKEATPLLINHPSKEINFISLFHNEPETVGVFFNELLKCDPTLIEDLFHPEQLMNHFIKNSDCLRKFFAWADKQKNPKLKPAALLQTVISTRMLVQGDTTYIVQAPVIAHTAMNNDTKLLARLIAISIQYNVQLYTLLMQNSTLTIRNPENKTFTLSGNSLIMAGYFKARQSLDLLLDNFVLLLSQEQKISYLFSSMNHTIEGGFESRFTAQELFKKWQLKLPTIDEIVQIEGSPKNQVEKQNIDTPEGTPKTNNVRRFNFK